MNAQTNTVPPVVTPPAENLLPPVIPSPIIKRPNLPTKTGLGLGKARSSTGTGGKPPVSSTKKNQHKNRHQPPTEGITTKNPFKSKKNSF